MDSENNPIITRNCSKEEPYFGVTLRKHPHYVLFYINLTKNSLTGLVPLVLLATMNYLVYRKLVKRRQEVEGEIATVVSHRTQIYSMYPITRHY